MSVNEIFSPDLDESIKNKINELKVIQTKLDEALVEYKESISELEGVKSDLVPEIMEVFSGQVDPGKKLKLEIDNLLVEVTEQSTRLNASYKNAFETALTKVNDNTKKVLEQILEESKVASKVKGKLVIDGSKIYEASIKGWFTSVKDWFGKAYDKLTNFSNKASEGVEEIEDMIKRMEDEKDGEMAMKNYDDVESGAIYESVNRMKAIIGVN